MVTIGQRFVDKKPQTIVNLTEPGAQAVADYCEAPGGLAPLDEAVASLQAPTRLSFPVR